MEKRFDDAIKSIREFKSGVKLDKSLLDVEHPACVALVVSNCEKYLAVQHVMSTLDELTDAFVPPLLARLIRDFKELFFQYAEDAIAGKTPSADKLMLGIRRLEMAFNATVKNSVPDEPIPTTTTPVDDDIVVLNVIIEQYFEDHPQVFVDDHNAEMEAFLKKSAELGTFFHDFNPEPVGGRYDDEDDPDDGDYSPSQSSDESEDEYLAKDEASGSIVGAVRGDVFVGVPGICVDNLRIAEQNIRTSYTDKGPVGKLMSYLIGICRKHLSVWGISAVGTISVITLTLVGAYTLFVLPRTNLDAQIKMTREKMSEIREVLREEDGLREEVMRLIRTSETSLKEIHAQLKSNPAFHRETVDRMCAELFVASQGAPIEQRSLIANSIVDMVIKRLSRGPPNALIEEELLPSWLKGKERLLNGEDPSLIIDAFTRLMVSEEEFRAMATQAGYSILDNASKVVSSVHSALNTTLTNLNEMSNLENKLGDLGVAARERLSDLSAAFESTAIQGTLEGASGMDIIIGSVKHRLFPRTGVSKTLMRMGLDATLGQLRESMRVFDEMVRSKPFQDAIKSLGSSYAILEATEYANIITIIGAGMVFSHFHSSFVCMLGAVMAGSVENWAESRLRGLRYAIANVVAPTLIDADRIFMESELPDQLPYHVGDDSEIDDILNMDFFYRVVRNVAGNQRQFFSIIQYHGIHVGIILMVAGISAHYTAHIGATVDITKRIATWFGSRIYDLVDYVGPRETANLIWGNLGTANQYIVCLMGAYTTCRLMMRAYDWQFSIQRLEPLARSGAFAFKKLEASLPESADVTWKQKMISWLWTLGNKHWMMLFIVLIHTTRSTGFISKRIK